MWEVLWGVPWGDTIENLVSTSFQGFLLYKMVPIFQDGHKYQNKNELVNAKICLGMKDYPKRQSNI